MSQHGGYLATSKCGCVRGWVTELDSEGRDDVIDWLRDGCTVRQMELDEKIIARRCSEHFEAVTA